MFTSSVLILGLVCGCAGKGGSADKPQKLSGNDKINHWANEIDLGITPIPYKVEPPDVITVTAPGMKELHDQTRTVGPDGKVEFNLIGSLYVNGKTTTEIADGIKALARRFYVNESQDVVVTVTQYRSKFIYVFGQLHNTGKVPWTGRDSLLQVIAQSQLNEDAWPEKVIVVRPSEDPNIRQKVTIDVYEMFQKGNTTHNILLEDGDVVYVPPTPLAKITLTFNKLLAPLIPASRIASIATGGI